MTRPEIVVIEDDYFLAEGLKRNIEHYTTYRCRVFTAGRPAWRYLYAHPPRMALIDLGLPDISGTQLITLLRQRHQQTGQIILTQRGDLGTKLSSFAQGVDDYLPKPFTMMELIARIKALDKRLEPAPINLPVVVLATGVQLHPTAIVIHRQVVPIGVVHYRLLSWLHQARPFPVSVAQLRRVLPLEEKVLSRGALATAIYRLRQLMRHHHLPLDLKSAYGQGYYLELVDDQKETQ